MRAHRQPGDGGGWDLGPISGDVRDGPNASSAPPHTLGGGLEVSQRTIKSGSRLSVGRRIPSRGARGPRSKAPKVQSSSNFIDTLHNHNHLLFLPN